MAEDHKRANDGLLEDGVSFRPANAGDMERFSSAGRALADFPAPILVHRESPDEKLFVAAFDGTGNDVIHDPEHATNVALIRAQLMRAQRLGQESISVGYVAGPGTQDNFLERTLDGARGYTYHARTEDMYRQLIEQAAQWKLENPNAQIRVADIGFSRGAEQAAGFSRLVDERGIQDPSGARYERDSDGQIKGVTYTKPPLVAPGQVAQAVGLFDPVGTGDPVKHQDRRLPPSVISGFQLISEDERRGLFKSTHIIDPGQTADGRFLGVYVPGAHSDVGGGYHRDGLSTRSGNLMIDYLNALSDQPYLDKRPVMDDPRRDVIHRSEEGMLIYRIGSKVDRLQPEGYVERLVPKREVDKVPDAYNAEPVDAVLRDRFERQAVGVGVPVPAPTSSDLRPAPVPASPTAGMAHADAALYRALRAQLPATMADERVMQATVQARREGIAPGALGGAVEREGRLWVVGTTTGYRAQIDLSQPAPPIQESMRQLQSLAPAQHTGAPQQALGQPESPGQAPPVRGGP